MTKSNVLDVVSSLAGMIPRISTRLSANDRIGAIIVRCGFNRNRYRIDPGLYAVGTPGERSDVLVTANYKLSFDTVRKNLDGLNAWLLVLDTKGINVWCAAGKGTFGTGELVRRIRLTSLDRVVTHRRLVLPQLGAVGVSAHLVRESSGFTVTYGPVRASDIPEFLRGRYRATQEMRRVRFRLFDRLTLIPNDFIHGLRFLLLAAVGVAILSGISKEGFSIQHVLDNGFPAMRNLAAGYAAGIVFTPLLLPYVPGRSFALKGAFVGLCVSTALLFNHLLGSTLAGATTGGLIVTDCSSFLAMNFTGSSTYTSLSGVGKEMRLALPLQLTAAAIALILLVVQNLV